MSRKGPPDRIDLECEEPLKPAPELGAEWERLFGPYYWRHAPEFGDPEGEAVPRWSTREQAETALLCLRGSSALTFRDAIEAAECVRVRLAMTLSESKVTVARLKRFDRAEDDCSRLREVLVYNFRRSQVVAQNPGNPDSENTGETGGQPINDVELKWLQETLDLIPATQSLRRRILNHAKLVNWHESEMKDLRRRLSWSSRTLEWLKEAKGLLGSVSGDAR
ncbi:hypothetical protein [Actomonas aquatica]|uniref:Uncharacterized protein n=1 Tax=Actomonas aquatica TaxID=2866162 RepID=A0ABZ1C495_9BACT|nr:hypothetical protein [Opitutus sp. WL0086]WRQ86519.1 hypothetical protein K1X11_017040 [Opitutus sp. WL0086]